MNFIEIIPNLWLGDDKSVFENMSTYKNLDFVFVNCNKDLEFLYKSKKYKDGQMKLNLEKYELIRFYKYLNDIVIFIYDNIKNNKSVIVHCNDGNQKSPTIVAAYLIKFGKLLTQNAINIIKTKTVDAFKNNKIDFIYPLEKFAGDLHFKNEIYNF